MFYKLSSLTSYLIGVMLHISGQPYGAFFNLTLMSIQFMAFTNWLSTLSTARQCVGPHAHLSNKKTLSLLAPENVIIKYKLSLTQGNTLNWS